MPRPEVKGERTDEILDAFERCIVRYGAEGSTLDRIANEAGLARGLLRHHVGNRDALFGALVDRFLERSNADIMQVFADLPAQNRAETLLDWLFDATYSDARSELIAEALTAAAVDDAALATRLRRWTEGYRWALAAEFERNHPGAEPGACADVAAGIVGITFTVESLSLLGRMGKYRAASKRAARRLIATLGKNR